MIAAGGTAGHVLPALALADALREREIEVAFLGGTKGFEASLVPAAGYEFAALDAQPVFGAGLRGGLRLPFALASGLARARARFCRERPALVIGFGGHASVAPVLAARSLQIATALYEANVRPGVANAALAPWVDCVHVAHPETRWLARSAQLQATGHPIRRELDRAQRGIRRLPRNRALRLLVLGGSQGSPFLNGQVPALVRRLVARGLALEVWHQAGMAADVSETRTRYQAAQIAARVDRYLPDLTSAYRWADFAISAAGAGSLAELAAMGLPALLVPLSTAARDHQMGNALAYAERSAALVSSERAFDAERLAVILADLFGDERRYRERARSAARAHRPGATERLVASCLELAGLGAESQGARRLRPQQRTA